MKSPCGLDILDNCMTCPVREQHLFCNLSPHVVQRLNDITSSAIYPRGAMLFIEGQRGRGVFVLCTGKVKLSTTSRGRQNGYHHDMRTRGRSGTECDNFQSPLRSNRRNDRAGAS
jgi:hypothetical protein